MHPRGWRPAFFLAIGIGLATFLVYLPALSNGFIELDDSAYVSNNTHIRSLGPSFFRWAFLQFNVANWHPLTWISHALDYAIWGLNPVGHHLTSIFLHSIVSAVVTLVVMRLLFTERASAPDGAGPSWDARADLLVAGVVGLLFGLHPVHVESVAWVAERKDLLCALFYLLAIGAYLDGANARSTAPARTAVRAPDGKYLASLFLFVLALLSKPMAVTLPAVLVLLEWYPLRRVNDARTLMAAAKRTFPFWLLSVASSAATVLAQRSGGALVSVQTLPLGPRLLAAARALVEYLGKMILPLDLVPYYPYPDFRSISITRPGYLIPVALVVAATALAVGSARRNRLWLALWGYYVVTLLPVLGIVQVGGQAMADRYTYLPSISPFLFVGLAVAWSRERVGHGVERETPRSRLLLAVTVGIGAVLATLTVAQIRVWKNDSTVFQAILSDESRRSPMVYFHRGVAHEKAGDLEAAISDFSSAIALFPAYEEAHFARGTALERLGQLERAREDYKRAHELNPRSHEALTNHGRIQRLLGHRPEALADFRAAAAMTPLAGKAHLNIGILLAEDGHLAEAVREFSQALAADPEDAEAHGNRAIALASLGQRDAARRDFDAAVLLNPGDPAIHFNRGQFLWAIGDREAAVADFRKACNLGDAASCEAIRLLGPPRPP